MQANGTLMMDSEMFSRSRVAATVVTRLPLFVIFNSFFLVLIAICMGQFSAMHLSMWEIDELSLPMRWSRIARDLLNT